MRELLPYLLLYRRHIGWIALGALTGLLTLLAGVGLISLSGWFISATAYAGLSLVTAKAFNFLHPGALVRMLAILRTVGRYGERMTTHEASFRLLAQLRVRAWRRLSPLSPRQLLREKGGDLLGRLTGDIDALDNLYLRVMQPLVLAMVAGTGLSIALSLLDGFIAWVVFGGYLLTGVLAGLLTFRAGQRAGKQQIRAMAGLRSRFIAGWDGFNELQVYGGWNEHLNALGREESRLLTEQHIETRLAGLASLVVQTGAAITSLSALWCALGLWQVDAIGGAWLALVVLGSLAAFEMLGPLVNAFAALGRSQAAAARLNRVLDQPPECRFPDAKSGSAPLPEDHSLAIRGLKLAHDRHGPLVLDHFNARLGHNEWLALSGPSGSGKSTLLAALVRDLEPLSGDIRFGDVPLSDLDQSTLRGQVAMLAQQDRLFDASLAENLRLAAPQAEDDELIRLIKALGLGEWFSHLPDGLNTWLGPDGTHLSGGQARRVLLGRVLLSSASLLLLDEPSEGLDRSSRLQLWREIRPWLEGRSLIIASHQPDDWVLCHRRISLESAIKPHILSNAAREARPLQKHSQTTGSWLVAGSVLVPEHTG